MKIIDRYIFRTVATTTLVALLVLLLLEFFLSLLAELEEVGQGDYDIWAALRYLLMMQPQRLYEMFPLALLVGGLLGMGALASGSELIGVTDCTSGRLRKVARSASCSESRCSIVA